MYRIYVNYNDEIIEEYDSVIAYRIMLHLHNAGMITRTCYIDMFGKEHNFTIVA